VFVSLRKLSFFSEGIAHASLAGVPSVCSCSKEPLLWPRFGASSLPQPYIFWKENRLSPDSLIGILFTSSLALGVLLVNLKSGYQPDLMSLPLRQYFDRQKF